MEEEWADSGRLIMINRFSFVCTILPVSSDVVQSFDDRTSCKREIACSADWL